MNTKLNPIGLYNTFETVEELQEYIGRLPKDDQYTAWLVFGLTWNTCAHLTDPEVLEDEK
jgi:hypothetical protein